MDYSLFGIRHFVASIAILFAIGIFASRPGYADDFTEELSYLDSQSATEVGRDSMVQAYEELLERHPQHSGRARAMLRIANLWQLQAPRFKIMRNPNEELSWLRKARSEAQPGEPLWFETGFRIAGMLDRSNPGDAKQLLYEILDDSNDPVVLARAYSRLQNIARSQQDYAEAERICHMLQGWMTDKRRQPESMLEKGKFFEIIQGSASSMMIAWSEMHAPMDVRKEKIDGLLEAYPGRMYLKQSHGRAITHLKKLPIIDEATFKRLEQHKARGE